MKKIAFLVILLLLFYNCSNHKEVKIDLGVSFELAEKRAKNISKVKYDLSINIPSYKTSPITGKQIISFLAKDISQDVLLDFTPEKSNLVNIKVNGKDEPIRALKEHILLSKNSLIKGDNKIEIEFTAGDMSLNRNDDFLYTLFVPDRARTAFPCFDQPNLKASYKLRLEVPKYWIAVANGSLSSFQETDSSGIYDFEETKPISTYLFAFVAGRFEKVSHEYKGKVFNLYHREHDSIKSKKNISIIFNQLTHSLDWLEEYTGIPYPFAKYDLIAVPSFQYGGMEHTGAVLYRASKLFLEENATIEEKLARASLIAHETAHMWFGDLVTMEWFNDVWTKEVFANFMADKITMPMFPEVNHRLKFLFDHYPKSYSVDRTLGATPIRQHLDNLNKAGTLYGAIIYHKSPIIMEKLEELLTKEVFRKGIQEYLKVFSYDNATWDQLINIFDKLTDKDIKQWSKMWVYEAGIPHYSTSRKENLSIYQTDPHCKNRLWNQYLNLQFPNKKDSICSLYIEDSITKLDIQDIEKELFILNGKGKAYGFFALDKNNIDFLKSNDIFGFDDLTRGIIYLNLYENLLNGIISPLTYLDLLSSYLEKESNKMNINALLKNYKTVYWSFLKKETRNKLAKKTESTLWRGFYKSKYEDIKKNYFETISSVSITDNSLSKLLDIWSKKITSKINLSEKDYIELAMELAIKVPKKSDSIIKETIIKIKNKDQKEKLIFLSPIFSESEQKREMFFNSLKLEENREKEPWVQTALKYLHHPIRKEISIKYIKPSLDMLEEIQKTGDIFFPKAWLDATFYSHNSNDAYKIVENFFKERKKYPIDLKNKILQSSDIVNRSMRYSE